MGRTKIDPAKKYRKLTINKEVPNDDFSFIRMNTEEYLAYLRHENRPGKRVKKEG